MKIITLFFFMLTTLLGSCNNKNQENSVNPNIIFIVCDDLNDAIEPLKGHPQTITPNLQRLADMGVNFVNAQVNSPICGPSRASFLSGLYPHTSGYFGYNFISDHWKNNPVLSESVTMMEHFRKNGYYVMGTGKVFHNNQEDWTVWDEFGVPPTWGPWPWDGTPDDAYEFDSLSPWRNSVVHPAMPVSFGIDDQFGTIDDVPDVLQDTANNIPGYKGWRLFHQPYRYNNKNDRDLMPDELNAKWVKEKLNESHEKPFLMCVGINRPHTPMFAPQEFFDLYGLDTLKLAESKENDDEDCAASIIDSGRIGTGLYGRIKYEKVINAGGELYLKEWTQAYLANVSFLDEQIGKILDELGNSKYAENTYIFFTSDHGYHMGEKEWLFKNSVWEEAVRVPFLVAGPDLPKGEICKNPVTLIDLFPTFLDLAELPDNVNDSTNGIKLDGHSLFPLMKNPKRGEWKGPEVALTAVASNDPLALGEPGEKENQFYSIRSEKYRYILCPNGEEELYNHENDPYEWKNLVSDKNYAQLKSELKNVLWELLNNN